jgi:hypothetical protein
VVGRDDEVLVNRSRVRGVGFRAGHHPEIVGGEREIVSRGDRFEPVADAVGGGENRRNRSAQGQCLRPDGLEVAV